MTRAADDLQNVFSAEGFSPSAMGRCDNHAMVESDPRTTCDECDGLARVHILERYSEGEPIYRRLCFGCADDAYAQHVARGAGGVQPRLRLGSMLVAAGVLLAMVGALADLTGIHGNVGFGWKQQAALLVGVLTVVIGALTRADVVAIAGSVLVTIAVVADVAGTMGSAGVGWRQGAVIVLGLALVLGGVIMRKQHAPRRVSEIT